MNKIRESKLALAVKVVSLGGLTGAISILGFINSSLLTGIFFGCLAILLTSVIIINWLNTGIFEEGNRIRISNKSRGINTAFPKDQIKGITLNGAMIEITLHDSGAVQFPLGDFSKDGIEKTNEWLQSI